MCLLELMFWRLQTITGLKKVHVTVRGKWRGDGRDSVRFHGYDFRGDVQDKDIKVKCDNGSRIECFRRCSKMHNSKATKGQLDPSWIMR